MITQADVDAGTVINTAAASATAPTARTSSPPTRPPPRPAPRPPSPSTSRPAPRPTSTTTAASTPATPSPTRFTVTNTGARTLTAVAVDDPKVGAVDCPTTTLAPGATTTCTAVYAITQADVNAGTVDNTADRHRHPPTAPRPSSTPDSTTTPTSTEATLTLDKLAGTPIDVNGNGPSTPATPSTTPSLSPTPARSP